MKCLIQKVKKACVEINDDIVSSIDKGLLILYGISNNNEGLEGKELNKKIDFIINRVLKLRVFRDKSGSNFKTSVLDNNYEILVVSQFTLFGDIQKSNKPNFVKAMKSNEAKRIYDKFILKLKEKMPNKIKEGVFGKYMNVKLENDGPVTLILEK
jgi:D-tyrosyl-tRNA(Tyr) deacylase